MCACAVAMTIENDEYPFVTTATRIDKQVFSTLLQSFSVITVPIQVANGSYGDDRQGSVLKQQQAGIIKVFKVYTYTYIYS